MNSGTSARNPQVPQTTGDTQYNVRDAALRGASTAFSKPPVKPKPQVNTYTGGNNGALLAATKVGSPRHSSPQTQSTTSPLRRDWTGDTNTLRPSPSPMQLATKSNSSSTLGIPDDHLSDRTPSPSNIAAKLAAARHSPLRPIPQAVVMAPVSERDQNERDILPPAGSVSDLLAKLDSKTPSQRPLRQDGNTRLSSATSTIRSPAMDRRRNEDIQTSLASSTVKSLDQNRPRTPPDPHPKPLRVSRQNPPQVRSPKPQRKIVLPPVPQEDVFVEPSKTRSPPEKPLKLKLERAETMDGHADSNIYGNLRKDSFGVPPIRQKPAQLAAIRTAVPRPQPPPKRGSRSTRPKSADLTRSTSFRRRLSTSLSLGSNDDPSSPASFVSAKEQQMSDHEETPKTKPSLPPPRRSATMKAKGGQSKTQPKVSSSPSPPTLQHRPLERVSSPIRMMEPTLPKRAPTAHGLSPTSDTIYHSNYQRESVKKISQHLTGESLSSAIVGAALASSRNASPAPQTTPVSTLARKHHHHLPFSHNRSPSPTKPTGKLRATMRKEPSSSSEEDESDKYKRKGTRVMGMRRKHPNKHHEGTRKRWRDTITERERKRYEGVWAANKGLYIQTPPDSSTDDISQLDVCSLVTKEIWTRSRLPDHELEEVWYLVDSRNSGKLRREEFVIGMWLIDQRLKGRKLPTKVSESVWGSVKGVGGVKVKVRK